MVKQTQVLCEFQSVKSSRPTCVLLLKAENTGQSHGATQDNCAITLSNNICIKCTTVSRIIFYFSMSFCFFVAFPSSFLLLFRTCQILRQKKTIESPWYFDCMSPMFWLNVVRQAGNKNTKKARMFLLCFNNYYCFIRFYSCLSFFYEQYKYIHSFLGVGGWGWKYELFKTGLLKYSFYLSIYLSIYLPIYLSVCLSIYRMNVIAFTLLVKSSIRY